MILNLRVCFSIHVLTPKKKWWFCPFSSLPHLVPSHSECMCIYIYIQFIIYFFYLFYYNSPKHSSFVSLYTITTTTPFFLSSQSYQCQSHLIRDDKMPSPHPNSTCPTPAPKNFRHPEKGARQGDSILPCLVATLRCRALVFLGKM